MRPEREKTGDATIRHLSDETVRHLRDMVSLPDFTETRYRVRSFLASGGMGDVYLAEDTTLAREVAVKVLNPATGPDGVQRMRQEAEVVAGLEHPAIVPVHDVGVLPDERVFYVMKYVRGRRLDEHVSPGMPLAARLDAFRKICDAVAFAHDRGVIHRDLKPSNVMVGAFGEVLVMDWGLAKRLDGSERADAVLEDAPTRILAPRGPGASREPDRTAHGTVLGTPGYMSPEQARGEVASLDSRTDVYALGAILAYLATGTSPSDTGRGPRWRDVPKQLRAIIDQAMASDPARRYATAAALGRDVSAYVAGDPVSAYPEGWIERAARVASRYRVPIALVLAYVVARAMVVLFSGR